ncbi:50S ribosomal protein L21 [Fusibacter tunisiensis]|jgi:large subunit ribosomal protein L21|uniref:Large ribosomal subunit protein bL21 n=1 Tax=Fusibacter tunisiensis TaxID=1008308 RepID=A0ABS2MMY1_9FIRM|nr:50S ribosomal protein L21 [Fusibacter tunisiensis]MBM7560750.1 large subunit ribosomal protein L21 [Fusibacter tunisiensis]
MYAIIKTGGKQYKVEQGDELFIEKLPVNQGDSVDFTEVLAVSNENGLLVGEDVSSAKVTASVVKNGKAAKVVIFKYKAKKDYRKKQGHRQPYTKVKIESISL